MSRTTPPDWLSMSYDPVREHWHKADPLRDDYPLDARISWLTPGGYEMRATWRLVINRVGLYQDLRVHPYDVMRTR